MMRNRLLVFAFVCLVWAAVAPPAVAQNATLDSRIEIRVEGTPAADVFRQIISGLGYELQMAPSIDAPVTLWISGVSARTALNVVCESLGCAWRTDGNRLVVSQRGNLIAPNSTGVKVGLMGKADAEKKQFLATDLRSRFRKPLPVDMQFQDVPVSTVLRALSEVSGLEITADDPLASQHVTFTGSGKTVEDALKAIIEQAGGFGFTTVMFRVWDRGNAAGPGIRIAIKARTAPVKK